MKTTHTSGGTIASTSEPLSHRNVRPRRTDCAWLAVVAGLLAGSVSAPAQTNVQYSWVNLAGQHGTAGNGDGTGRAARFTGPSGVAVDSAGNVYVADQGNHTIRKVNPAGVVTTLAGDPTHTNAHYVILGDYADGPAARRGSIVLSAWRWTARATCMWRTRATTRFGR